jgi:hypothetical protein
MPVRRVLGSLIFGIILLFQTAQLSAQTSVPSGVQVYSNFLGTWTGTNRYKREDIWHEGKLKLRITSDKRGMRFDYDYLDQDKKGKEHHDRSTRFVTLIPNGDKVVLQWDGSDTETYRANGLSKFAETGFGAFSFSGLWPDRKPAAMKCMFTLSKDEFAYQWESGDPGSPYQLTAVWTLKKIATTAPPSP